MGESVVPGRRAGIAARRRRAAVIVAIPLGVMLLVGVSTFTPVFGADEIVVHGSGHLSPEAVTSLAGIGPGTNVVHLDAQGIARSLEADPWIERATVSRDLPSTIVVSIVERVPVARIAAEVLAADGTVLPGADPTDLPSIRAVVGEVGPVQRADAAAAVGGLARAVRGRVDAMIVEPDGDLVLVLDDGVTVFYGASDQRAAKAEALRVLLRWVDGADVAIESADVSVPSAPTARPVGGAVTTVP